VPFPYTSLRVIELVSIRSAEIVPVLILPPSMEVEPLDPRSDARRKVVIR